MARQARQTVVLYARIDPKLKERLGSLADKRKLPESVLVEEAISAYVDVQMRGAR